MISSADFFEEISSDRFHGASQIYAKFLSLFTTYLQQVENPSDEFFAELPTLIVNIRKDMAPFYYAALRVSDLLARLDQSDKDPSRQLPELFAELRAEQSAAIDKIIENARPHLEGVESVMLHSNSGTVTKVVKSLIPQGSDIYLSEAVPDREGEKLGEELAQLGFQVTLFPDDARYRYVKKVDRILLGSDWIGEDSFLNKIGTNCIALSGVNENKPVVIVADSSKLVPARFRRPLKPNRVRLAKRFYRETCSFEHIDNQLVDTFVTDRGAFSSDEISSFVKTRLKYVNFALKQ